MLKMSQVDDIKKMSGCGYLIDEIAKKLVWIAKQCANN